MKKLFCLWGFIVIVIGQGTNHRGVGVGINHGGVFRSARSRSGG